MNWTRAADVDCYLLLSVLTADLSTTGLPAPADAMAAQLHTAQLHTTSQLPYFFH